VIGRVVGPVDCGALPRLGWVLGLQPDGHVPELIPGETHVVLGQVSPNDRTSSMAPGTSSQKV
jgi:hypothetical protein